MDVSSANIIFCLEAHTGTYHLQGLGRKVNHSLIHLYASRLRRTVVNLHSKSTFIEIKLDDSKDKYYGILIDDLGCQMPVTDQKTAQQPNPRRLLLFPVSCFISSSVVHC